MRGVRSIGISLLASALILMAGSTPVLAGTLTVGSTPYTRSGTLEITELSDDYELTASSGQSIVYSMSVQTSGGCAQLYLAKGHNIGINFQYFVSYSQDSCVQSYSNTFPVDSGDGTEYTIVLTTNSMFNVNYTVSIDITTVDIAGLLWGIIVVFIIVVIVIVVVILVVLGRKKKAAAQMPPYYKPPMQPPAAP